VLVIPATTTRPTTLSVDGARVWDAVVRYGVYVTDQGGGNAFTGDPNSVTAAQGTRILADLGTIVAALHHATP
jgi:hypothetical protein